MLLLEERQCCKIQLSLVGIPDIPGGCLQSLGTLVQAPGGQQLGDNPVRRCRGALGRKWHCFLGVELVLWLLIEHGSWLSINRHISLSNCPVLLVPPHSSVVSPAVTAQVTGVATRLQTLDFHCCQRKVEGTGVVGRKIVSSGEL